MSTVVNSESNIPSNSTEKPQPSFSSSITFLLPETLLCYVFQTKNVKILSAIPGTPSMDKEEVNKFLENKLLLQIGTIDDEGDPNIQPVWFDYDRDRDKLLIITPKAAKKVRNLRSKPNVYFSVDDENFPYKGVKGKGTAAIIEDPERTVPLGKKINMKYLGTLDHPIPMMILYSAKKGNHVIVEISPRFFSTWDFAKMQ
jgi:PPOX class probable F420-dependent enzyme